MYLFLEYPKCSTCRKAKKWLDEHQVAYQDRHIVENNPTVEELSKWTMHNSLSIKKFFNTSGLKYKSLNLKDKLPQMSVQEQLALLASDGMLVKRPLLISDDFIIIGFRPTDWESHLLKK